MTLLLFPLIAIFVFLSIFTQYTAWTEMIVYPYLLNNGFILYKELIHPYTPLVTLFLQPLTYFLGYSPLVGWGLTIVLGTINILLIYLISLKISRKRSMAFLSSAFYVLWFFYFEGNGLWFELFQAPFILLVFYFASKYFLNEDENLKDFIAACLFLSAAFFIKQSASWLAILFLGWILFAKNSTKRKISLILTLISIFIFFLVITVIVASQGGYLYDYLYWSFGYTYFIFPYLEGHKDFPTFTMIAKLLIPLSAFIPFLFLEKDKKRKIFYLLFLLATFLLIFPRWGLFHLQPFLGVLSLISISYWEMFIRNEKLFRKMVAIMFVGVWLIVVGRQINRFWQEPIRFFEPRIYRLSEKISKQYPDFLLFNTYDQIYTITRVVPKIKPYVQNFSWYMELPGMQERLIDDMEKVKPEILIISPFPAGKDLTIENYKAEKMAQYIEKHYILKQKMEENILIYERRI